MKRSLAYIFISAIIIGFVLPPVSNVAAESISGLNDKLSELKKEKNSINEESGSISSETEKIEEKIAENEGKQSEVTSEIDVINADLAATKANLAEKENEITTTNQKISQTETEITETEEEIAQLKIEIIDLEERIAEREELLKNRLRAIQKNGGDISYLQVLMGAQNFGDFLNRATAVTKIMDQDKEIMDAHQADKEEVETKKVAVEDKKDQLENDKASLEDVKASLTVQKQELDSIKATLDNQIAKKQTLMANLEHQHSELEEYTMTLAEEQKTLSDQASIIEKAMKDAQAKKQRLEQLAEEQAKAGGNNSSGGSTPSAGGNGSLIWPASGSHTSPYGYRSFNGGGMHYGLDIANSVGTPIKAAASGIVTRSNFSSSYGNVVYIYHPDLNLTTVYAHLSSRGVSFNQSVSQGETIGGMGNTGNSFGSHLHFEVHIGGWQQHGAVNPSPYLP